ncbi:hypothetical protein [Embleya sp. AB8]|uniref:hypothetical protein n=1 Tax=Embleya sp. AB8 TaxID=3156304 RepID=UPI003C706497
MALLVFAVLLAAAEGDGPNDCDEGCFSLGTTTPPTADGPFLAGPASARVIALVRRNPPAPAETHKPTPSKPVKPRKHHHGGDGDSCD